MKKEFGLFRYWKENAGILLVLFLTALVFGVTFWLYDLPLGAVAYPALVSAVFAVGFLLWSYGKQKKRYLRLKRTEKLSLQQLKDQWEIFQAEKSAPTGALEEAYETIISGMLEEYGKKEQEHREEYEEMMDYYSLWVHQIKTPIASMRLALQNEDTPFARRIAGEVHRTEQYVEMVLAFLRLKSDFTDYVIKEYDLDEIIKGVLRRFAKEFIDRKLSVSFAETKEWVLTDEKWLSFVLEQVVSNALKYTKEGGVFLYMEENQTLCIRDTGIGIAPEDIPRIFERGYTGYNGRQDNKASGIGLFLCRQVCDRLNHTICAESSVGEGTVVKIGLSHRKRKME